ncbi:hypothetical protein [Psittacicella hinzii]|uniref:Uncharacterized protein n=1 Tax=Psittacicella hinzii TaxID=2028575 RepID=A0A3A1YIU4_9GAMM|nr:hypothetical protein [Psittacicella hinzii]RIY37511.1 hypothetical protein CKF58_04900 [Psittacicella hinzii]
MTSKRLLIHLVIFMLAGIVGVFGMRYYLYSKAALTDAQVTYFQQHIDNAYQQQIMLYAYTRAATNTLSQENSGLGTQDARAQEIATGLELTWQAINLAYSDSAMVQLEAILAIEPICAKASTGNLATENLVKLEAVYAKAADACTVITYINKNFYNSLTPSQIKNLKAQLIVENVLQQSLTLENLPIINGKFPLLMQVPFWQKVIIENPLLPLETAAQLES